MAGSRPGEGIDVQPYPPDLQLQRNVFGQPGQRPEGRQVAQEFLLGGLLGGRRATDPSTPPGAAAAAVARSTCGSSTRSVPSRVTSARASRVRVGGTGRACRAHDVPMICCRLRGSNPPACNCSLTAAGSAPPPAPAVSIDSPPAPEIDRSAAGEQGRLAGGQAGAHQLQRLHRHRVDQPDGAEVDQPERAVARRSGCCPDAGRRGTRRPIITWFRNAASSRSASTDRADTAPRRPQRRPAPAGRRPGRSPAPPRCSTR